MKINIEDIISFIGDQVVFNDFGDDCFWGKNENGKEQMIAEIRAYGAIRKLFMDENRKPNLEKEKQFQADLGIFIAKAITEKIEREKQ